MRVSPYLKIMKLLLILTILFLSIANLSTQTPCDDLVAKQPAIVEWIDYYCNPEKMFNPKSSPNQIMVFDDEYFDKSLSAASPQFIVVYWRKEDANKVGREGGFRFLLKREFIPKFEANFDFEALTKMLGK